MADRDWSKELAKVDKQIASLPNTPPEGAGRAPVAKGTEPPAAGPAAASGLGAPARATSSFGVYARLTLSVALGVAMTVWPYDVRCGGGLAAYLGAVGVVITSGVWSAVWTWRHRAAKAHVLSLLLIVWGLVLGATEVLPRVGYAKPDALHPARWTCQSLK